MHKNINVSTILSDFSMRPILYGICPFVSWLEEIIDASAGVLEATSQ
jgi:hypothetical protein